MKTKFLLLFTIITFLTACKSNEIIEGSMTKADLIGDWNLVYRGIENGTINIDLGDGNVMSGNCTIVAKDIDIVFSFSDTPKKALSIQGKYTTESTFTFLGETHTETEYFDSYSVSAPIPTPWKLNADNTIKIDETTYFIKEFSKNSLKLSAEQNEIVDYGGQKVTIKGTENIVLEK